jgi:nucleolar complex protein 3
LNRNEIIKAKKKTTMGALKKGPVEQTADDIASESDNSGDDSDLEGMEIDMDSDDEPMSEEDFSDMEDGHYETKGGAADSESEDERIVDSDDEQDYEQAPRKAEGWSEKGSTRLPIKLADGRIKEVEDNRVRPSEKKDDDSEEEEVADSDFAEEDGDDQEGASMFEEEEEEEKPAKKLPKKVVLAQKKEEMATIAQTIIADPEANVRFFHRLLHSI